MIRLHCQGPCNQGRKPCPHIDKCLRAVDDLWVWLSICVAIVACVAFTAWVMQ
jgi:hypothetical protein